MSRRLRRRRTLRRPVHVVRGRHDPHRALQSRVRVPRRYGVERLRVRCSAGRRTATAAARAAPAAATRPTPACADERTTSRARRHVITAATAAADRAAAACCTAARTAAAIRAAASRGPRARSGVPRVLSALPQRAAEPVPRVHERADHEHGCVLVVLHRLVAEETALSVRPGRLLRRRGSVGPDQHGSRRGDRAEHRQLPRTIVSSLDSPHWREAGKGALGA
jgi:hypothetical protein